MIKEKMPNFKDIFHFPFFLSLNRPQYLTQIQNKEASRLYAELLPYRASGRHADDMCRPPVKSHLKSCSRAVHTSSARHPPVVCTRFQPQKYFLQLSLLLLC